MKRSSPASVKTRPWEGPLPWPMVSVKILFADALEKARVSTSSPVAVALSIGHWGYVAGKSSVNGGVKVQSALPGGDSAH
jgi:hypothetical protein